MTDDLFGDDPNEAKKARDAAFQRIRENGGNWEERALLALQLLAGFEGTAEDIRVRLRMKGLSKPHHHNAWGAMISKAIRRRLILENGKRKHMRLRKSHHRETDVYVVIGVPLRRYQEASAKIY